MPENGTGEAAAADLSGLSPLLAYDAAVALMELGDLELASRLLEQVSVRGTAELRQAATFNVGAAWHGRADRLIEAPAAASEAEPEDVDAARKRWGEAIAGYRRAISFYERVRPRGEVEVRAIAAARVRVRQAVDALRRLEEAERLKEEEALLNDPPRLVAEVTERVRARRRALLSLEGAARRALRLPLRRARETTAADRALLEKLRFGLEAEASTDPSSAGDEAQDAASAAGERLVLVLGQAIEALSETEGALAGYDTEGATAQQGVTIERLLEARLLLPLDLAGLLRDLEGEQRTVLERTRRQVAIAREEREIGLVLGALGQLDPEAAGGAAESAGPAAGMGEAGPGGAPALTPEILTGIRDEARAALEAVQQAVGRLAEADYEAAVAPEEKVLEHLAAMRELLPKREPTPEERLRALLAEERAVDAEVEAAEALEGEARAALRDPLVNRQAAAATEALEVAEQLTDHAAAGAQPPPGAGAAAGDPGREQAAEEVRSGHEEVEASRDLLGKDQLVPAGEAVERAIAHFERALELLESDEDEEDQEQNQDQEQDPGDEKSPGQQDARQLSPEEARRRLEELDRDRRELEKQLFPGTRGPAVEKDW
jgi:hypothetical protein